MNTATSIAELCESLARRPDAEKLYFGLAVPHKRHIPGASATSRVRDRAFVVDAGTLVYVSCVCGATPHELAEDLEFGAWPLQPFAAEQTLMLKIQRRLRDDLYDQQARELLRLKGIPVAKALMWRMTDAGTPSEQWDGKDMIQSAIDGLDAYMAELMAADAA